MHGKMVTLSNIVDNARTRANLNQFVQRMNNSGLIPENTMKITERQLKRIIREAIQATLNDTDLQKIISEIKPLIAAAIQGKRVPDIEWNPPYTAKTSFVYGGNISITLDAWLMDRGYTQEYGKDDFFFEVEAAIEEALASEFPEVRIWSFSSVEEY